MACKSQAFIVSGIITKEFRGNLGVVMFNMGNTPLKIYKGDRIAQLFLEKVNLLELEEVQKFSNEQ
jgi:dUTP pyrophosphatase